MLTVVLANLGVLRRQTALDPRQAALTDAALAAPSAARRSPAACSAWCGATRRPAGDPASPDLAASDLSATVAAFLPFLQANVLRDAPVVTRIPEGLPKALCGERLLELVLLNLAVHVRDLGLPRLRDRGGGASGRGADAAGDAGRSRPAGLFASGRRPSGASPRLPSQSQTQDHGRALATVAQLVRERGGGWRLVCDGRGEEAFLAEVWLRAEAPAPDARPAPAQAAPLRILLVESDSLVRASVAEALGELGHAVVQAAPASTRWTSSGTMPPSTR